MFLCFVRHLAALLLLAGSAATSQTFTSSGEMNITACPITFYGRKYHTVHVAFDADRFAVCFNGAYRPGLQNDCILMSGGTADRGGLSVLTKPIPTGSGVHKLLPNLKNAGKCVNIIPLKDSQQAQIEQVELGNFGTQAILAIKTYSGYQSVAVEAEARVNGLTVSKHTFLTADTNNGVITDMSGCRYSGAVYKTNTTVFDPNICSTVTCDVSGVATAVSNCGPMESCQGDGSCRMNAVCTVTGPSVISFVGRVHSVPDRCAYTLMAHSPIPGLRVLGLFQERRRKDVSFLDRVILRLDGAGVEISLEQSGRFLLNDKALTLNAAAQVVHGVQLSQDQTGLTAKISASNYSMSVHFDGHTTLIHLKGPSGAPVNGLCGDSDKSLIKEKVADHSAAGCEVLYDDDADSKINCKSATRWCNNLKWSPFTACNKHVNPEPFITACTNTLCTYPAVDHLKCQFLEAYARTCSHHSNVTMETWRVKTKCPAGPQAFCPDRYCSPHEFCGDSMSGEPRCLCRAIFASQYRSAGTFGEMTVCDHNTAALTLANCLLEEKSIDYSVLHLNDEACKGEMNHLTHMVTFSFGSGNTCGTVVMANSSGIISKNTIMTRNISMFGLINRQSPVHIDFSCHYRQPDIKSMAIRIKDSSVAQQIISGEWNYNLTMKAYYDANRMAAIEASTEIQLDMKIWVELKAEGLDENMIAVVTDSCWATDQPSPTGSLRYDLIIAGCPNPADQTVQIEGNGLGTSNYFSFNTFQFSGRNGDVYLHCRLELCVAQSHACAPSCGHSSRRIRSIMPKYLDEHPAFISLAWTH